MNKMTTISALALAAGAACAAVESENIVGYQDFTGSGSFNLTVATFLPVGTDGSTMTLGNIVGNDNFVAGTDFINIYDNLGMFVTDATYSSPEDAAEWEIDPGWYTREDYDNDAENNLSSTSIPYGAGFAFCRTTSGAALKYVGELKQSSNTLPASGSFNLCGNTSPKDITLGDIVGNDAFVAGTDFINIYDNLGMFVTDATYSSPEDAAEWEIDPGWYTREDYDNDAENNLNSTPIPAGSGFAFCKTTAAARLIVASPVSE